MSLNIEQKSVYLVILNATMILRAVGKTLKRDKTKLRDFKIRTFREIENLTTKMEQGRLKEEDVISSIEKVSRKCHIPFGQAQKAISVLLKYHYYLNKENIDSTMKKVLYCPLDSVILTELGRYQSLTSIDKTQYLEIQQEIAKKAFSRIDFDRKWDIQHLKAEGIWRIT